MKKIAFLVLALATAVFADEGNIEKLAKRFETDVQTMQKCFDDAETNIDEILALKRQLKKADNDNLDENTKNAVTRHSKFVACLLEEKGMMVDSKLMVDKIFETLIAEKPDYAHKDELKECITTINVNDEWNREDKALRLMLCITNEFDDDDDNEKKK